MKTSRLNDALRKERHVIARVAIVTGGTRRIGCAISDDMVRSVAPAMLEKFVTRIPVGRLGQPMDIARAVLFLVVDVADFITGSTLSVNDGQHMYWRWRSD